MSTFKEEVHKGKRFEFGKNWHSFLSKLTDERIRIAENSIIKTLNVNNLNGRKVLDIGSGSGLFSLAARKMGAEVHSFDYDPASVACTKELCSRYFPDDLSWVIEEGSILEKDFLESLGRFDLVYAWGVLHHTGNMWAALENVASLVKTNGTLFIAIYNDQGKKSIFWRKVKKIYCSGILGRTLVSGFFIPASFLRVSISSVLNRKNLFYDYKSNRGMSITHDWFDWLGGFPFEVAKVEEIYHFFQDKGFVLKNIVTTNGWGNNQFVFSNSN